MTGWKTTTNADSRVKDWLYGVRAAQPDKETQTSLTSQPLTQAERFRIVHHMITSPREEGGAGLTPKQGEWKNVESIFPLHDLAFNKEWMRKWASSTFITAEDLDELRDRLGEKVGNTRSSWGWLLTNISDRFLLRVHAIIFCFSHISSGFWVRLMGPTELIFTYLRYCQQPLVPDVHRVLEATGTRPWCTLGCERCICHSGEETGISA